MKVFIGVGHGGSDPGAVSYLVEKDVNLVEALACRDFLEDTVYKFCCREQATRLTR